jgi:alpha-tubulin suppressor-like RCC1 family protein
VFCFGENLFGQLGVEVEGAIVYEPNTIPAFKDVDIEDVSCGFYFTLFHART